LVESPRGEWGCPTCGGHHLDSEAVRELVVDELGVSEAVLKELPSFHRGGAMLACPCGQGETSLL